MAEVILDTGDPVLLEYGLTVDYTLRLYTNDLDPSTTNVIGDFTECTDADYAAITLTGGSWSVTTESAQAKAEYAMQTFSLSALSPAVYGWYLDRAGVGVAAGRLDPVYGGGQGEVRVVPVVHGDHKAA
jgi:hypothetical protein